jgi:PHS family inorganic phosphate transporter-like MFS transporter
MRGYVYWNADTKSDHETGINSVTLSGCIIGMILLGVLADLLGRKRLYGWELVILIASSLGVAMSGAGKTVEGESSMRNSAWFMFMRFIAGVGIGVSDPFRYLMFALWLAEQISLS